MMLARFKKRVLTRRISTVSVADGDAVEGNLSDFDSCEDVEGNEGEQAKRRSIEN